MIKYSEIPQCLLDKTNWREFQSLQRQASASVLTHRSQAEVDELVDWNDPERYYQSHIDPNSEVGRRFNDKQEYSNPRVATARDFDTEELVGFAYAAYNVSGSSEMIRAAKKRLIEKNYFWIREIAVRPDYQRQRIAMKLAHFILGPVDPESPLTAYGWVDEIAFLGGVLDRFHAQPTPPEATQVFPFGDGAAPVRQVRFQGQAGNIRDEIKHALSVSKD